MTSKPPSRPRPTGPASKSRTPGKDAPDPTAAPDGAPGAESPEGDRIAKVLARSGVASRREAEKIIEAGRVTVNGRKITSPALNVTPRDRVQVDGKPLAAAEPARLWLYHKPTGLVTTTKDEQGRETIFDKLPEEMPRVMSVGRLDLNSEGLLLLTNDGGIKRQLELPSTGWMRKYRVRVKGNPSDEALAPLREGIVIDREEFQPMMVSLDRQQGANAWLTVGLREGKNREIRRAMESIGLVVNRLIRVSYGPFQLGQLKPGQVEEVRRRVMRDQLGLEAEEEPTPARPRRVVRKGKSRPAAQGETPWGEAPARKPGTRAAPGGPRGDKPAGKPGGKSFGKAAGKPAGKSFGKPEGKPAGKGFGKAEGRPSGKAGGKPGGKSFGKAGGRLDGKAGGTSGDKAGWKPSGKTFGSRGGPKKR